MLGTLGGPEIVLILVIALIVFGPRKLPEIGRTAGKMLAEFRKASAEFQRTIDREVAEDEAKSRQAALAAAAPAVAAVPAAAPAPTVEAPAVPVAEAAAPAAPPHDEAAPVVAPPVGEVVSRGSDVKLDLDKG